MKEYEKKKKKKFRFFFVFYQEQNSNNFKIWKIYLEDLFYGWIHNSTEMENQGKYFHDWMTLWIYMNKRFHERKCQLLKLLDNIYAWLGACKIFITSLKNSVCQQISNFVSNYVHLTQMPFGEGHKCSFFCSLAYCQIKGLFTCMPFVKPLPVQVQTEKVWYSSNQPWWGPIEKN